MLDQAFHAAQACSANKDFCFRRDRHRYVASILHFKRKHPAERRHLPGRNLMAGMRLQARIMDTRYSRVAGEKLRNFHCVLRVRAHPPRQRAHAAQDQPAIERRGDCAALVLNAADTFEKIALSSRNDNSSEYVAMTAEIFC